MGFLERLLKPPAADKTPETTIAVLPPRLAARYLFDVLTENDHDRNNVLDIGKIYHGDAYEPEHTANSLLTYGGFSMSWFKPDLEHTRKDLTLLLKVVFHVELSSGTTDDRELEFLTSLGRHVHRLVRDSKT